MSYSQTVVAGVWVKDLALEAAEKAARERAVVASAVAVVASAVAVVASAVAEAAATAKEGQTEVASLMVFD